VLALGDIGTFTRPYAAWLRDGAGPGSPWYLPTLAGHPADPVLVAIGAAAGWVLAVVLVVVLARRRPRPVVAAAAVVGMVAVMVTGPALPPSAGIWLVPFVALLGVGWRDHLLWAGAEVVHAVALLAYLSSVADPAQGLPAGWYSVALILRLLALGWLAGRVWEACTREGSLGRPADGAVHPSSPAGRGSWADAGAAGTLSKLPSRRPVENSPGRVGGNAYPPVTEGP
jgi:hypothetical protein